MPIAKQRLDKTPFLGDSFWVNSSLLDKAYNNTGQ
jgi:hypothetical protein